MKSAAVRILRVQTSLGCATDHERESKMASMGVTTAKMHSSDNLDTEEDHILKSVRTPSRKVITTKPFHTKFVLSTRNGGKKIEQRMKECPNYTLPNLRAIPCASTNPWH